MTDTSHERMRARWPRIHCALALLVTGCTVSVIGSEIDPQTNVDSGTPWSPDGSGPSFPDAWTDPDDDPDDEADDDPDDVPDSSGCLAGTGDYRDKGPYPTTTTPGPSGYTVFHPADLDDGCLHPIVAWGNGTGVTGTSIYAHLNEHMASWGIVVIASHSSSVGSGEYHRAGIDWLLEQNASASSRFYGTLSARAGVAGHSQGGMGASAAVTHANVEAEVNVQGGGSSADRAALLLTGTSDFMSSSIHTSYNLAQGPAFLASYQGADHISTPTMAGASSAGGVEYRRLYVAWMRCWLGDDAGACALFEGGQSCGICGDPGWAELVSKNF